MKPAWDQLMEETAGSSVVVGDADCTEEADLCQTHGVKGYPTIKYYTAETGKEGTAYNGGRELTDLQKFVDETLAVKCQVSDPSGCSEKEVKFIAKFKGDHAAIDAQVARLTKMGAGKMKAELKVWLNQRLTILKQLQQNKDEL